MYTRYIQNVEKDSTKNSVSTEASFKSEGEIRTFPDKQKLREFVTSKPAT